MTQHVEQRIFSSYQWTRQSWRTRVDVIEPNLPIWRHVRQMLEAAERTRSSSSTAFTGLI
jgi:hypothetical protein